ncbi:uncharacterized protein A4U43_C06F8120 [Asparagus officinalis]|uniref:Protein kinase domain-containing protein n=1 Tax=Asparagus officinalis TaxID=4686 RepID=A0A5P1EKL9_ASPOF|nr:probable LRR receptor-like serine/threonine-protein kinase At1g14390 [Asparagus officinalis]ONK66446.1 uncharacterized protein A4U43_C06F8120 [Asparagus officinalis]
MTSLHFLIAFVLVLIPQTPAQNLSPSQTKTLIRLRHMLNSPPALSPLSNATNFCYLPPSQSLSVSCLGNRITELRITGTSSVPLPPPFSVDSFFTTLTRLPSLTSLSLVNLGICGPLPAKVNRLSAMKNLVLSGNFFNGTVPDLKKLTSLTELDLSNNSFSGSVPTALASLGKLEKLDLSKNQLKGNIPPFLFSLRSVQYLDLSKNRFSGALPPKLSCGDKLEYVDISRNLLVGGLPSCLVSNSSSRVVLDSWNCMKSMGSKSQHPSSYCSRDPLAAILPPSREKVEGSKSNLGLILGIIGGVIGSAAILALLVFLVFKKVRSEDEENVKLVKLPKPVAKTSVHVSPRTPADTRHMSQAVRIGTLGLTPYRVFTMEEIEEATNGFETLNLISDGAQGQMYKGWLREGSRVVVRCLKLKQRLSPQSLTQYTDIISKLRHVNLVSILGHCIHSGQDGANETIFLVFEYVSNGTLRSHLTEWRKREMLKWPQRVSAVIGVARGIQFLHTVTVPGIVGNDLGIENILLDETLTAKICNYNLPMISKNNKIGSASPFSALGENDCGSIHGLEHGEKEDVYQLGLILLEIITGKPPGSQRELEALKVELQDCLSHVPAKLREITDPTIRGTFAFDSLQTLVGVALNCVAKDHKERPSIDDVLWNLQYSVQVQDGWTSSDGLTIN